MRTSYGVHLLVSEIVIDIIGVFIDDDKCTRLVALYETEDHTVFVVFDVNNFDIGVFCVDINICSRCKNSDYY